MGDCDLTCDFQYATFNDFTLIIVLPSLQISLPPMMFTIPTNPKSHPAAFFFFFYFCFLFSVVNLYSASFHQEHNLLSPYVVLVISNKGIKNRLREGEESDIGRHNI
jgi:hypothetical protein